MRKFVICGKVFTKEYKRGADRYAFELILALDKYIYKNSLELDIELLVPNVNVNIPVLNSIKVKRYGGKMGLRFWQYIDFQYYILKNKATGISLITGDIPFINPGIVTFHDMIFKKEKNDFSTFSGYLRRKKLSIMYYMKVINAKIILTVSNFSKKEINKYYGFNKKIFVIYNGWEHLQKIKVDDTFFRKKYSDLIDKRYYFFLGAREKHKNLIWIYKIAKRYKNRLFIMAGPPTNKQNIENKKIESLPNVKYIGYISDEEICFFMKNCEAFIFPSIDEGFGIPPLEALYFGAKVLCSNSSCLPEIYKDYVVYFNPYDYDVDLNKLLMQKVKASKSIFDIYSWNKSAKSLFSLLKHIESN